MTNGFKIIGVSVRTTNKENKSQQDIGELWERFYKENIFEQIPNKASSNIVSIYTDYKSDFKEDYTTIIGREFKVDKFQKFIAKGEMPKAIVDTWIEIWNKDNILNRKYNYDFELYDEKSQNGENSEVGIYLSVI